ncbi:efflux RND transporter periplasmic adaptor subunit [Notoacmeibacter marinus]|uniref:efflux RND transporter periplasmic adaptor subunit n=1 Tax=Notoacmeibacter marinus TaxID=1876515 RepID=UPI0013B050AA|nr:HlyD family efflux transporter periplasmic adaptor subunit [Notoacmeibacter marinus]
MAFAFWVEKFPICTLKLHYDSWGPHMLAANLIFSVRILIATLTVSVLGGVVHAQGVGSDPFSNVEARGLVSAVNRLDIGTDLMAPVTEAPYRDGQAFRKGDILIRFACQRYRAEWTAAQASSHAAQLELAQKSELSRYGAAGKGEVDIAKAGLVKSRANAAALAARLESCEIVAPFDGRVIALNVSPSELPRSGQSLISILDDQTLEIEFVAPSHWLRWIEIGQPFSFRVDETGEILSASVARIAAEVDAVSQTIRIIGRIQGGRGRTLAGMSGTAHMSVETTGAVAK